MRYTKKDLVSRFFKTYWPYVASIVVLIVGFMLVSGVKITSLWYPIGMALVAVGVSSVISGCQFIRKQKAQGENFVVSELTVLSKKIDEVFGNAIKLDKSKEFSNEKKYEVLLKLSRYLNAFLTRLAVISSKELVTATFMDYKLVNYFSVLKIKVEKEIKAYQDNKSYKINWDPIYNLFVEERVEDLENPCNSLEYLSGLEGSEIDNLKPSFWSCLNIEKLLQFRITRDFFYRDGNTYYYSKVMKEANSLSGSNIFDFFKLISNVSYLYEDPEAVVWAQNRANVENINVYDYADLVYKNLEDYYNGNIDKAKAIRTLRNIKVQLPQAKTIDAGHMNLISFGIVACFILILVILSVANIVNYLVAIGLAAVAIAIEIFRRLNNNSKDSKFMDFRREALDIVIEKLK